MNDSYDAITVRPVDSSIGVNISVEKAFAAYENSTPTLARQPVLSMKRVIRLTTDVRSMPI